jgi:thiamine-monophosphate kinase
MKGESGFLAHIEKFFQFPRDKRLLLGPGDDCAVLRPAPGKYLVITTDELVENTHFLRRFSRPEELARKLLRINLSDLAAMGRVRPVSCLAGAGLPKDIPAGFVLRFLKALKKEALKFGISIAGGNLSRAREMHFYMTVWGEAGKGGLVTRYGARPGDILFNLGPLGEAKAGLELLKSGSARDKKRFKRLVRAFWEPKPFLEEGAVIGLRGLASAMLDNSDGLARSAVTLSEFSGCRVRVNAGPEAVSPVLTAYAAGRGRSWREYALSGGEDYGLVFTAPPAKTDLVKKLLPAASAVGLVEKGVGVVFEGYEKKIRSFSHF